MYITLVDPRGSGRDVLDAGDGFVATDARRQSYTPALIARVAGHYGIFLWVLDWDVLVTRLDGGRA